MPTPRLLGAVPRETSSDLTVTTGGRRAARIVSPDTNRIWPLCKPRYWGALLAMAAFTEGGKKWVTADGVAAADGSSDTYALVSNTESRPGLLLAFYSYVLFWFFLYCYPIARWTVRLEAKYAVNI